MIKSLIKWYDHAELRHKNVLKWIWVFISPIRYLNDKFFLKRKVRLNEVSQPCMIDKEIGFTPIFLDKQLVERSVSNTKSLSKQRKDFNTKPYLQEISDLSDYGLASPEFQLATHPEVVKMVENYLGSFPYLYDITALWSPSSSNDAGKAISNFEGSQLWHRDSDDVRIAKIWILCSDVDEESGPTVLLPANESEKIAKDIKYKQGYKVPFQVETHLKIDKKLIMRAIGSSGTTYFTDTDRLFHYGSRTSSTQERLVLMFHYVSFFSCYFRPINKTGKKHKVNPSILEAINDLSQNQKALLRGYL